MTVKRKAEDAELESSVKYRVKRFKSVTEDSNFIIGIQRFKSDSITAQDLLNLALVEVKSGKNDAYFVFAEALFSKFIENYVISRQQRASYLEMMSFAYLSIPEESDHYQQSMLHGYDSAYIELFSSSDNTKWSKQALNFAIKISLDNGRLEKIKNIILLLEDSDDNMPELTDINVAPFNDSVSYFTADTAFVLAQGIIEGRRLQAENAKLKSELEAVKSLTPGYARFVDNNKDSGGCFDSSKNSPKLV
jgi:hypothetical protein